MVLGLLASLLEGIGIGLLIPLVALLLADLPAADMPEPIRALTQATAALDTRERLFALGAGVLGLIGAKAVVQYANGVLIAAIQGRFGRDLRDALAAKILALDFSFYMKNDSNRLAHVISADSWHVMEASRWLLFVVPAAAGVGVFGLLLAWLDWRLFLIVLAGAAVIQGALYLVERRQRRLSFALTAADIVLWERMLGIISAMRVIRVFGQQAREEKRFAVAAERFRTAALASQRLTALVPPAVDVMTAGLFLVILASAYSMGIGIPTVVAFLALLSRAQPQAQAITQARLGIASVRGSLAEVEWLLGQESPRELARGTGSPPEGQPIRFENVSYAYPDGSVAVTDVTFSLKPGIATALIGRSGSGKTTLVNLICRLVEPAGGAIYAGDRRLDEFPVGAWRERIAIAGQDIELVDGTVAENIAYGRPDAPRHEIEQAAVTAGADGFIALLPRGYETEVGQEGVKLSGGQRQRIGLARALLRNPDLLILDEATSAVDALSEREIMNLLAEHRNFRTALVISHRRSTLFGCQEGIVIDEGRIVEAGPLGELAYFHSMAGHELSA